MILREQILLPQQIGLYNKTQPVRSISSLEREGEAGGCLSPVKFSHGYFDTLVQQYD
jgi:hypothetical protein